MKTGDQIRFFFSFFAFLSVLTIMAAALAEDGTQEDSATSLLESPPPEDENPFSEAERFYNDCAERPVVSVNPETDMAFCACAAAHLQAWIDRPQSIGKQDSFLGIAPIKGLNKDILLSEVYGPCLHIPVYDLSYENCYYNSKKQVFSNDPPRREAFCACIAGEDAAYFRDFAKPFLEMKIAERKDVLDPIEEIKKDTNYYDARFFYEKNCFATWSKKR